MKQGRQHIKEGYYPVFGMLLLFFIALLGSTIEDLNHGVILQDSLQDRHHYILPVILGLAGYLIGLAINSYQRRERTILMELLDAESKLKTHMNHVGDAIYVHDWDGNILDCNRQAEQDLAFPKAEILKLRVFELDAEYSTLNSYQELLKTIGNDKPIMAEVTHRKKGGEEFPVEVKVCMVHGDGEPLYLSIARDISERRETISALTNLSNRFKLFYDEAPLSYQSLNMKGIIIDINPTWTNTFGYKKEEIIGQHFSYIMTSESKKKMFGVFEGFVKNGFVKDAEFEVVKENGEHMHVTVNGNLSYNSDGSIKQTHCILTDITERKFLEEVTGFTSQLGWKDRGMTFFRILTTYLCQILDVDYAYIAVLKESSDSVETLGYSSGKESLENFSINLLSSPCNTVIGSSFRIYEEKVGELFPDDQYLKDIKAQGFAGYPIRNSKGRALGLIGLLKEARIENVNRIETALHILSSRISQEIEQLKSESALLASQERFRLLSNLTFEAIFIHRGDEIVEVNKAALETFAYSEKEVYEGIVFSELFEVAQRERIEKYMSWHQIPRMEVTAMKKDGTLFPAEIVSKGIEYRGEQLRVTSIRDITNRKDEERKVFEAIINTEERERKRFAEDLHDELGPVLSGIKLYIDELSHDDLEKNKREELNIYLKNFINDAVSKTRSISHDIMPSSLFDYGLEKALDTFCTRISSAGKLKIALDIGEDELKLNKTIELVLYRVIKELLNNTIKYAEANHVHIHLMIKDDVVFVEYRDDGKGFDRVKIMEEKSGLGLTNIENRIKSLNGHLEFKSEVDRGVFYQISIPI